MSISIEVDQSLLEPAYTFEEVIEQFRTLDNFRVKTLKMIVDSEKKRYSWYHLAIIEYAYKLKVRDL